MERREVHRRLTVSADTSSLAKASRDVASFEAGTGAVAAELKRMREQLDPTSWRAYAASMKPALEAEREMLRMTKAVTSELKPYAAELRKVQAESLKHAEAINKRVLSESRAAESLRKRFDTNYGNAQQYFDVEQKVQRQIELRNLTTEQGNTILAGAAKRYDQVANDAGKATQAARLTSNQMGNLGYQANDVATMMLMGASPFQIIASQAGQVVQALGDGPQGVRGSLAAIGSSIAGFARAIPTGAYAVAGLTAAVGALWYLTKGPEARSAEESVKSFEDAIRRLEDGWKGAGEAARRHYEAAQGAANGNQSAAILDTQEQLRKLREDYKATIRDLNTSEGLPENILRPRVNTGSLSPAHQEIRQLYTELRRLEIPASQMEAAMLRIRLDPNADDFARGFAEAIRQGIAPAVDLERRINAISAAADKLGGKGGRVTSSPNEPNPFDLRNRFGGGVTGMLDRFDPAGMEAIRSGLKAQTEELTRAGEATRSYSDAVADQKASLSASVAQLRLQVDLYDQSEGALAAARFRMNAMAEAQRAASEAKQSAIDPALVEQINREAIEYGRLTDQIKSSSTALQEQTRAAQEAEAQRKRVDEFSDNLDFQRSILFLPAHEQEIRSSLRGLGVDFDSFEGRRLADSMRFNKSLSEQHDAMRQTGSLAQDMGDIFSDVTAPAARSADAFFTAISATEESAP